MRSGAPDSLDLMVATNYAVMAADLALEGASGRMVALRSGTYTAVPISRHARGRQAGRRRRAVRRGRVPAEGAPRRRQADVPVLSLVASAIRQEPNPAGSDPRLRRGRPLKAPAVAVATAIRGDGRWSAAAAIRCSDEASWDPHGGGRLPRAERRDPRVTCARGRAAWRRGRRDPRRLGRAHGGARSARSTATRCAGSSSVAARFSARRGATRTSTARVRASVTRDARARGGRRASS